MPSSSSISYDYECLSVIESKNLYYRSSNFYILKNSPSTTAETGTDFPVPEVLVHFSGSTETYRKICFTRNLFTPQSTHRVWQRPLSGVHSIMMEKLAQAGEGSHPPSVYLPVYATAGRAGRYTPK
jgi:hypothetical protein